MQQSISLKLINLQNILREMEKVVVAFSGGVDSTFLLKVAADQLGSNAIAVTATSETYPKEELVEARQLAKTINAKHIVIETEELSDERFLSNPPERCFYCKSELFTKLKEIAASNTTSFIIDGANMDDAKDFRPGHKAGKELGVRSPLREAQLTKEEIRLLSKELRLPTWDKPAFACLSSRFPYGHRITLDKLEQVHRAETFLRSKGFKTLWVRHHQDIARVEIQLAELSLFCQEPLRSEVVNYLKEIGFAYITLDLEGFRSGSMNEVLSEEILNG